MTDDFLIRRRDFDRIITPLTEDITDHNKNQTPEERRALYDLVKLEAMSRGSKILFNVLICSNLALLGLWAYFLSFVPTVRTLVFDIKTKFDRLDHPISSLQSGDVFNILFLVIMAVSPLMVTMYISHRLLASRGWVQLSASNIDYEIYNTAKSLSKKGTG